MFQTMETTLPPLICNYHHSSIVKLNENFDAPFVMEEEIYLSDNCGLCFQQTTKRNIPMLFVRGDGVILVSPPLRVGL